MDRQNVLVLVQNAPVLHDRRVWQECRTLAAAGYRVTVVCPAGTGKDDTPFEVCDGVSINRYPRRASGSGLSGHAVEYVAAAWHIARIVRRLARSQSFDIVHACNPPDFLLLVVLPLKWRGARMIFDQHDLVPEMFVSRFGTRHHPLYYLTLMLERMSFRLANVVLSTNESYRRVACARGGNSPEGVFVVRNAPDANVFRPGVSYPSLCRGKPHLLAYVGVMDPHDDVDWALRALANLRQRRDDWHALLVGDGAALGDLKALAAALDLTDVVEFAGWLGDEDIVNILSTADVCLSPEVKTSYNDASTMVKVAEYMAMERPVVCFDLAESRVTAREAAVFATPGDVVGFANWIATLLDDPVRRRAMGDAGRRRVTRELTWSNSERMLLAAYRQAIGS